MVKDRAEGRFGAVYRMKSTALPLRGGPSYAPILKHLLSIGRESAT
jgi:hypothetical protein